MPVLAQFFSIFFCGTLSMADAPKGNPKANRLIHQSRDGERRHFCNAITAMAVPYWR
jgi:hypothetical protein